MKIISYQPEEGLKLSDRIYRTGLEGLYYIDNQVFADERGFFTDLSDVEELKQTIGIDFRIKQINQSRSLENVVRGIHAEDWNKLVTITSGTAYCAIASINPQASDFGKTESFVLSKTGEGLTGSLFLSRGLGNSICVLEGPVDYVYAVDQLYKDRDKSGDQAINLFDPDLNIAWPKASEEMIISERDKDAVNLRQLFPDSF